MSELISSAAFSPDRKFRFALWRIWNSKKPLVMFIGLNPSTANEENNDPTIRRVIAFAKKWDFGGVYMMNCFPLVSSNPEALKEFETGSHTAEFQDNNNWLQEAAKQCKEVVFAWGSFDIVKDSGRAKELIKMFPEAKALVINNDGSPRHPLYVKTDTVPVIFNPKIPINSRMNEAQKLNAMLISEIVHPMLESYDKALAQSNKLFEDIYADFPFYKQENTERIFGWFVEAKIQNKDVFQNLFQGNITTGDAVAISNSLFVDFFNQVRGPVTPIINMADYRTYQVFNF